MHARVSPATVLIYEHLFTVKNVDKRPLLVVLIFLSQKEQLSRWCSTDVGVSVRQVMPVVFGPELARQLSLKGHNGKKQLADTNILDVIAGELSSAELKPVHGHIFFVYMLCIYSSGIKSLHGSH